MAPAATGESLSSLALACLLAALLACAPQGRAAAPAAGVLVSSAAPHGSTLPEYAAPRGGVVDRSRLDASDVIAYRTLERADFKSQRPPPEFGPEGGRLSAATCAYILTTPDTQVMLQPVPARGGKVVYRARPRQLRFEARMDRNCSWWNPQDRGVPEEYILEHEQIHFALFELEARRLNAEVPQIEKHMHATADSSEEAVRVVEGRLAEQIQSRMQGILARSREFDEDTSMSHAPEQQRRWWERVHAELGAAGH
jgi:hypothetical protein